MKVAIHQPNYLPWIGYFNKVSLVDRFVFFDDVQLVRGKSYSTRVEILINRTPKWLTIPVLGKSKMMIIKDVKVNNTLNWKKKHLKTLELSYKKAEFFDDFFPTIEEILSCESDFLIDYNIPLIEAATRFLGIDTQFYLSSQINSEHDTLKRILGINKYLGATSYLTGSGKGSKRYLDEAQFEKEKIELEWLNYEPKTYTQLNVDSFIPNLSIIDLIFNEGRNSINYIRF